ncbi:hypothetical protein [Labilithrix luteola]|nr:hypothetical protein [Labilithrix luteola]
MTARTPNAWAGSTGIDLDYSAPSECASEAAFASAVHERLADRHVALADQRNFKVRIVAERGQYLGALEASTSSSVREVSAATCDEVVRALVVFVALAVTPSDDEQAPLVSPPTVTHDDGEASTPLALEDPKSATAASDQQARPSVDRPKSVAPAAPSQRRSSPPRFGVGLRGIVATGVAPALAPGGAIDASVVLAAQPRLRWLLHVGGLLTYREAAVLDGAFTFTWAAARVDVGPAFDVGRFRFSAGPVAHAGVLAVSARNLPSAAGDSTFWGDVGGFARVDRALSRSFGLSLMLELAAPLQRRAFGVRGVEEPVQSIPPVFGVLSLGVTVGP